MIVNIFMSNDEKYMSQAIKLARFGCRAVAPNPMVGAIIVKNGKIIGKGYHQKFGWPHAEVNAVKSVKNWSDLIGATIYITLEPCRHWGKTPPCLDLIKKVGIARVICGSRDPFQKKFQAPNSKYEINSKYQIQKSKQTIKSTPQIRFLTGAIEKQCRKLNKFFFTWVTKKRPYITVKIAMSADGFIAGAGGKPIHFTDVKQDREIHQLRADHQAIMVGINTVLSDNPRLDVRLVKGEDPLRIILDTRLRTPRRAKVLKDGNYLIATTSVVIPNDQFPMTNLWKSPTKKHVSLKKLFAHLAKLGISSILVEPGPTLYRSLKKQCLIDEVIVYKGKKKIGEGIKIKL